MAIQFPNNIPSLDTYIVMQMPRKQIKFLIKREKNHPSNHPLIFEIVSRSNE